MIKNKKKKLNKYFWALGATFILSGLIIGASHYDWSIVSDKFSDISSAISDVGGSLFAAASGGHYIHVREGMRKEEIADLFAGKLNWSSDQKLAFLDGPEGQYFPGTYAVPSNNDESVMREVMLHRYEKNVAEPYASSSVVTMPIVLKIASIIEREAGGKRDMRIISGIIWNRIFDGMTLDIDATLQYAKGTSTNWWPTVHSADKKIESPYNTYKYKGFPPTPIANPGLAAIDAALNPIMTDCIFYLHDAHRKIHCAATYSAHVRNVNRYLK